MRVYDRIEYDMIRQGMAGQDTIEYDKIGKDMEHGRTW